MVKPHYDPNQLLLIYSYPDEDLASIPDAQLCRMAEFREDAQAVLMTRWHDLIKLTHKDDAGLEIYISERLPNRFKRYSPQHAQFSTWLGRVLTNLMRDYKRSPKSRIVSYAMDAESQPELFLPTLPEGLQMVAVQLAEEGNSEELKRFWGVPVANLMMKTIAREVMVNGE